MGKPKLLRSPSTPEPAPAAAAPAQQVVAPPQPTPETREQLHQRGVACQREIAEVLARHGCTILPIIMPPTPVGETPPGVNPSSVLFSAGWTLYVQERRP